MPRFRQSQYSHGNQLTKNLDYSSSFCRKTTSAQKILVTRIQNVFFRVLAPQKVLAPFIFLIPGFLFQTNKQQRNKKAVKTRT